MKAIVIFDDDGHVNAFEHNFGNLKKLLQYLVDYDKHDTIFMNGTEDAEALLQNPNATEKEMEDFIKEEGPCGRSCGNRVNILTINKDFQVW